jgi:rhodanese-related sulfurtransferase
MNTRSILVLILVLSVAYFVYTRALPLYRTSSLAIMPEEVRNQRFSLIVDVRSPKEREEYGYYPNSVPISMDQLQKEIPVDLAMDPSASILVYSNGDTRAQVAAEIIYSMGYTNVRYLREPYHILMPGQLFV